MVVVVVVPGYLEMEIGRGVDGGGGMSEMACSWKVQVERYSTFQLIASISKK